MPYRWAKRCRTERDQFRVEAMKAECEAKLAECEKKLAENEAELQRKVKKHATDLEQHIFDAAKSKAEYKAKAKRVERKLKADLDFLRLHAHTAFVGEDVRIKLRQPDGGKLQHARRFILASKSTVFKKMFGDGISRKYDGFYTMEDYSAPVMRSVLKFCHDAEIEFTKEVTPEEVLAAARAYEIGHLEGVCVDELRENWKNLDSAEDINSEAIDFAVLEFCCTGGIIFTEEITAREVLKVACRRKVTKLEDVCTKELLATLNRDNLTEILRLSKVCCAARLEEEATKYVKENFDTLFPQVIAAL